MQIDLTRHRELQSQGIISIQQHPELPLLIHNYTQRCQWERLWDETTVLCRGLITDLIGNVVSRPFPKFFNLSEHTATDSKLPVINWNQKFTVSDKLDGSLGITYPTPNGYRIATRGSFISEQAQKANEMLATRNARFRPGWTYLFEIIYPENRIVVDYEGMSDLILLEMIGNETGDAMGRSALETEAERLGFAVCPTAELVTGSEHELNREGVVVRFDDGTRVKIKFDEYCRLHKLITGLNTKSIWEMLRDGKSLDEVLERVPDEFFAWVKSAVNDLELQFAIIQQDAESVFADFRSDNPNASRKEYARHFQRYPELTSILFLILDNRDYRQAIWKKLKPKQAMAFATADE